MSFESIEAAEQFYKNYAHDNGFSVHVGQQRLENGIVYWKRFLCSRQGFRKNKCNDNIQHSGGKKTHNLFETRCGCDAYIYVKLSSGNRYTIEAMIEEHNHGLVSPDKRHLLRSNRSVSERAKNTLYNCHTASMGTSQAYRLLHVSDGVFDNVGCTLRDLQNYYRDLRKKITNADAEMFIAQLERKKKINPTFFYDFDVDKEGRLVYVFWADAMSRKNYTHFCDLVSFDSTYSTNQYDMIFAPFTGVNHHLQSIFIGGAFLVNEKTESYEWLFKTFLVAMGGVAPSIIITDEAASIRAAIAKIFPDTIHRLCMWHIMEKFPEKVSGSVNDKEYDFWPRLNACVWGSETGEEFESQWTSLMIDYGLHGNEWIQNRYHIRESWIPAYYMDVSLAGILRTTSRSESANSFF
jgi:hypothetical protein